MGRKPVLGLAGMFLAGVTLTGCECTDWCCFGNNKTTTTTTTPAARPAPNWTTPPMNQTQPVTPAQPTSTGANRFGTPSTPPVVQPVGGTESSALPGHDSSATAQPDSFQSSRSSGAAEINPPTPPSGVDRQPVSASPTSNANMISPATPRTTTPSTSSIPALDAPPPLKQPLPPLPPEVPTTTTKSVAPEPPTNFDSPPPPQPVPTKSDGATQSSSKYQGGPSLDLAPPPPPRNVPPMPGAGPNEN